MVRGDEWPSTFAAFSTPCARSIAVPTDLRNTCELTHSHWGWRLLVRGYYAISPFAVRHGKVALRVTACGPLDMLVRHLRRKGVADTPYIDAKSREPSHHAYGAKGTSPATLSPKR